jgi:DNA-binding transcriptional MerR regulator
VKSPLKDPLGTKLYYSISEVAELTRLPPYTLRAWEKEFACLRPRRARGKNRAYRERDIQIILLIKSLLYDQRYTMEGVKQKLLNEPELLRGTGTEPPARQPAEPVGGGNGPEPVVDPSVAPWPEPAAADSGTRARALLATAREELREILDLL